MSSWITKHRAELEKLYRRIDGIDATNPLLLDVTLCKVMALGLIRLASENAMNQTFERIGVELLSLASGLSENVEIQ